MGATHHAIPSFANATEGRQIMQRKGMGISGKHHDDDGFAALAQLESQGVALGSPQQSLGEDV